MKNKIIFFSLLSFTYCQIYAQYGPGIRSFENVAAAYNSNKNCANLQAVIQAYLNLAVTEKQTADQKLNLSYKTNIRDLFTRFIAECQAQVRGGITEKEFKELENLLNKSLDEQKRLQDEIAKRDQDIADLLKKIAAGEKGDENLKKLLTELQAQVQEKNQVISDLRKAIEDLKKIIDGLRKQNTELINDLKNAATDPQQKKALEDLQNQLKDKDKRISDLLNQIENLKKDISSAKKSSDQQLETLRIEIRKLQDEVKKAKPNGDVDKLKKENDRLQKELRAKEDQLERTGRSLEEALKQVKNSKGLRDQLDQANKKVKFQDDKLKEWAKLIDGKNQDLEKLKVQLADAKKSCADPKDIQKFIELKGKLSSLKNYWSADMASQVQNIRQNRTKFTAQEKDYAINQLLYGFDKVTDLINKLK